MQNITEKEAAVTLFSQFKFQHYLQITQTALKNF